MARRDYTKVREGHLTCTHSFVRDCEKCRREVFALAGVKDGRSLRNGAPMAKRSLTIEEARTYGLDRPAILVTLFPTAATKRVGDDGTGWTLQKGSDPLVWGYPTTAAETFHACSDAMQVSPEQLADIAIAWALKSPDSGGSIRRYVRRELRKVLAS